MYGVSFNTNQNINATKIAGRSKSHIAKYLAYILNKDAIANKTIRKIIKPTIK